MAFRAFTQSLIGEIGGGGEAFPVFPFLDLDLAFGNPFFVERPPTREPVQVVVPPPARPPPPLPPPPPAASVATVSLLDDIVGNVFGAITGGSVRDINAQPQSGISNVINDFILGATTSRQERAATGNFRTGDFQKILERDVRRPFPGGLIGPGAPTPPPVFEAAVGGIGEIVGLAAANFARGTQPFSGALMPPPNLSLVNGACPTGGPQSYPAGTCLLDFQWENAGGPRGFEMIGRNEDGRAILRKRGRRRRRHGLTKSQMGQVSWACNLPPNCRKEVLHGIVHG